MNKSTDSLNLGTEPIVCELSPSLPINKPLTMVVFGATGDLTRRKIMPALYNLTKNKWLPNDFTVIAFARRPLNENDYKNEMTEAISQFSHTSPIESEALNTIVKNIKYYNGDILNAVSYSEFKKFLETLYGAGVNRNLLFYMATEAEHFSIISEGLASAGLAGKNENLPFFRRIIVEKPFGKDGGSASILNAKLQKNFFESEIYRIDHYLGKDTVQNLLYFRFANSIFEPLWNHRYVDSVQITVSEKIGVGSRGGYYDKSGATRDMIQNHLLQLLTLVAMEPPASLDAESIRDEKVKVLRSIPRYSKLQLLERSVRAQYSAGTLGNGQKNVAYVNEDKVNEKSTTETFVALQLEIDNWRFAGVPFYLRTGKALAEQKSEIVITFKRPPSVLFAGFCGQRLQSNRLVLTIQPNEGITLQFNAKVPARSIVQKVDMDFCYREQGFHYFPEAYERLLMDVMMGDSTLFTRWDEVAESWKIIDALFTAWNSDANFPLYLYPPGSNGPTAAAHLLERTGRSWKELEHD